MLIVDDMHDYVKGEAPFCHLIAQSNDELTAASKRLRLGGVRYFDKNFPHYRLTEKQRIRAIKLGAFEADRRTYVEAVADIEKAFKAGSY